jgi:hypothetical protein
MDRGREGAAMIDKDSVKVFSRWLRSGPDSAWPLAIELLSNAPAKWIIGEAKDELANHNYSNTPQFVLVLAGITNPDPKAQASGVDEARRALYEELEEFARGEG